jgi:hypothetical protein
MNESPTPSMSRRASIILAIACLIFGLMAGGWSVAAYWAYSTNQFCISTLTAEAGNDLAELELLRAGKTTNAVELMEVNLDGDLIGFGGFLRDPHELKRNPLNVKILQRARDYRARFPHGSGSAEVDEAIAKAFHLLDGQKGF